MDLQQLFLELGYANEEYNKIKSYYSISKFKNETLLKRVREVYDFLIGLGYTKENIIMMSKRFPSLS